MSNISELLLRTVVDANYQTKGETLSYEEVDNNFILLANIIKENILELNPGGIEAYDGGKEFSNGNLVTYGGNLWEYTNPTPSTGNVPSSSSIYWTIQSTGILAHAQNTDTHTSANGFGIGDGTTATNKSIYARNGDTNTPSIRYNETSNKWEFSNDGTTFAELGSGSGGGGAWADLTGLPSDNTDLVSYVSDEITAAVVGLFDDRGNYDPTGTSTYPASGGSGTAGAILKGDIWTISVDGTIDSIAVKIGDTVRALVDTPGTISSNWSLLTHAGSTSPVVVTQNITGATTIDCSTGDIFINTLTGNVTNFDHSNAVVGKTYVFKMIKDTSNKTITWAAGKWRFPFYNPSDTTTAPGLTDPTTNGTSPAHSEDIITAICTTSGKLDVVVTNNLIDN